LNSQNSLNNKLKQFIIKYYTNELIKGFLLFIGIGLIYFFVTIFIEHFLWLSIPYRTFLFWVFIISQLLLFYKFICIPIFKLLGFTNRISNEDASLIIGNHFPEVNDQLINLLQLKKNSFQSELLLASIKQKTQTLSPVPFNLAINFKTNFKYLYLVLIPFFIYFLFQITDNNFIIKNSYTRVVNHNIAYLPPAPFKFIISNPSLSVIENKSFTLNVSTVGDVVPDILKISFNNETYFLNKNNFNSFSFDFNQVTDPINFILSSNSNVSSSFLLSTISPPSILNFKLNLIYPKHTFKKNIVLSNVGNVSVPEGTNILWTLNTKTTDSVFYSYKNSTSSFYKNNDIFTFKETFLNSVNYKISTSNTTLSNYENYDYNITVIPDEYPKINLESVIDSTNSNSQHFIGFISDDYALSKLEIIYKKSTSDTLYKKELFIKNDNFDEFTFSFPGNLSLENGFSYDFYFQVYDNDILNNFKKSKSKTYTYKSLSNNEIENLQLDIQKKSINNLSKSILNSKSQKDIFTKIDIFNKQKNNLSWNDNQKISSFIKNQISQDKKLLKLNNNIQNNLSNSSSNSFKNDLLKRLKEQEKSIHSNQNLLKELSKFQNKINDEDFLKTFNKLGSKSSLQQKSLEQILELTKRFYVQKKIEKLANSILNLSKKQFKNSLNKSNISSKKNQDSINKEFNYIKNELDSLSINNNNLKIPFKFKDNDSIKNSISNELQKALDNLLKSNPSKSKNNQKNASDMMKDLSSSLEMQIKNSSVNQLKEDEKMLRQILDNLICYSFEQEFLINDFKSLDISNFNFSNRLKKQYTLKEHFNHIDDSLFSLSLRNPKLSNLITAEINSIHFNIDKSLSRFSDQKTYLGISNQQYALTSTNNLANLLSKVLQSIQDDLNSMNMPGNASSSKSGNNSEGFQLSDIIKKQDEILNKIATKNSKQKGISPGLNNSGKSSGSINVDNKRYGDIFKIFQEQQNLKNLYKKLSNNNNIPPNNVLNLMNQIENNLLNSGISDELLKNMNNLKHQLLKLDNASFEQDEDSERNSKSNFKLFDTSNKSFQSIKKQYFNEIEILNRQALPLQPLYKKKVQQYFNILND
jgi:hypothetical protein